MKDAWIIILITTIAGGFTGLTASTVAKHFEANRWRQDAIDHGHAEYYLDDNNERQWRWKDVDND